MIFYTKNLEVLSCQVEYSRGTYLCQNLEAMLNIDAADVRGSREVFLGKHSPTIIITYSVCTSNRKEPDIPTDYKKARSNFTVRPAPFCSVHSRKSP